MESTEVIIARLVLGYLKGEKCKSAYKEFLKTSNHLQDDTSLAKGKYLPTRFVGLTLEDVLSEYFEIYKIVQGRLESTNYYNESHSKVSLVQQLLYLLNKTLSSRASTPCPRSPLDSNIDDTSMSQVDHISDVETTPAHTLPGNIRCTSEDSYLHKTPRKKLHSKVDQSATVANFPNTDKEDISEVLAQTLLENKEFHEKIAQTINKVAEKQYRVSSELDKTIKTVVKKTEEDPIFDKILDEIIGSTNTVDNCKGLETSSTTSSVTKNTNENTDDRLKRMPKHSMNEYIPSYRSFIDAQKVEEQNNEAVRSIVANSKLGSNKHVDNRDGQGNNEVIVFDGSLDKYLLANTCNANTQTQPMQNPLYINTTGSLLMVPSGITTNVSGNLQIDTSNQYYLVNKQPAINWNVPTIKTHNIITEQDILAMPTVIVNDEMKNKSRDKSTTTQSVIETPALNTVSESPALQHIVPKPVIEIPNIEEYFTLHGSQKLGQSGLKNVIYPKKTKISKPSEIAASNNTSEDTVPLKAETSATDIQDNAKFLPDKLLKDEKDPPTKNNVNIVSPEPKFQEAKSVCQTGTPLPEASVTSQKVTPKSSSHVRNLDFSTPPKVTSTHKKTMKTKQGGSTPPFVHKKQAAKTLFKAHDTELTDKDENVKKVESKYDHKKKIRKSVDTWDADLRAAIPPEDQTGNLTPKRKRKTPVKKVRKVRKVNKAVVHQLNTTEHDAALLEAALKTPIKTQNAILKTADNDTDEIKIEECDVKENICVPETSELEVTKKNFNAKTKVTASKRANECKRKRKASLSVNVKKMIVSPSKLNANKRRIVTSEIPRSNLANGLTDISGDDGNKFITPELVTETVSYPIKANRNITPMLETPLKTNFVPKTPGLETPMNTAMDLNMSMCSTGFTPFTKMLEANLKGIDINSLPTPNIPITPNFPPFTPTIDLISPYSNRPTDYSTSSSYYQPSDSEQNRSLEANVIEQEKKPITIHSDIVVNEGTEIVPGSENCKQVNNIILKEQIVVVTSGNGIDEVNKNDQNIHTCPTTIKEHLNIFNKNVIGKKNLNLMKRNISSSSSSSDDSTSESSNDEIDSCTWIGDQSNETVIFKKKPDCVQRTYLLRNRTTNTNIKEETVRKPVNAKESKVNKNQSDKEIKANPKSISKVNPIQGKDSKVNSKPEVPMKEVRGKEITTKDGNTKRFAEVSSFKQNVLKELEEKRLRTINKFKNCDKSPPNKSTVKTPVRQSKFIKIKPIPNLTNTRRKPRKSASPRKAPQTTTGNINSKAHNLNYEVNDSKKKDGDKKTVVSSNCGVEKAEKSASDVEAQNLIEGLKERGIHLMHNKSSPTKKINRTSNESKMENEKPKNINSTQSKNNLNISVSPEIKKHELSTSELESELRETYDTQTFEEVNVCVVFDESNKKSKTFESYDTEVLKKTFVGKVFLEEIDAEIDVPLVFSPFFSLLDIQQSLPTIEQVKNIQKTKETDQATELGKKCNKRVSVENTDVDKYDICLIRDASNSAVCDETQKSDDDLMNYAIVGSGKEGTPEGTDSPKSTRKRKHLSEENSHTEKKCKTLLKKINVDSFLNNIHGGS